jgi:hypothetical protein
MFMLCLLQNPVYACGKVLRRMQFEHVVKVVTSVMNSFRGSRDSSVGIALGYGLDDRGSRVRFPAEAGNFSLHHRIQNGSGAHPASYLMGRGVKLSTHLHLVPRSMNECSYTSTSQYAFMA